MIYKKKFQFSCCLASKFSNSSDVGLILLFTNGRIEMRWRFSFIHISGMISLNAHMLFAHIGSPSTVIIIISV